jgi:hypothetical protein
VLRIAGIWWIVVSLIHGLGGIIIYSKQWQAIAQDGWFNVIAPNPLAPMFDREDAFWFLFMTPFLFIIGRLCLWADYQRLVLPMSVGFILLATTLIGIFLEPVSGIWLVLPPSLLLLLSSRFAKSKTIT